MFHIIVSSVKTQTNSIVSDAAGGVVGFVVSAIMVVFALCIGPMLALEHFVMRPDFAKVTQTNETGLSKKIAQVYVAVIPDVTMPDIVRKPGQVEYKPGRGFGNYMSNVRWVVALAYLVGGWLFFAAQLAAVYKLSEMVAKRKARLWWIPSAVAVVHYVLPLYLMSHFSYVKYLRF